jgi:hypothetical protein
MRAFQLSNFTRIINFLQVITAQSKTVCFSHHIYAQNPRNFTQFTRNFCQFTTVKNYILTSSRRGETQNSSQWSKQWLLKPCQYSHINVLQESWLYHPTIISVNKETYLTLLSMGTPLIAEEHNLHMADNSSFWKAHSNLADLNQDCKVSTISHKPLGKTVHETCSAIYKELMIRLLIF